MKILKKILLICLCTGFLAQIPLFYNRLQVGRLADKIASLNGNRKVPAESEYIDYKGVIHVHSFLGGHSTGTFDELIHGAKSNELDFVVMTEHVSELYDTSAMTLRGQYQGVLFVNGNETRTRDGNYLLFPKGFPDVSSTISQTTANALENAQFYDLPAFVAYPEKIEFWEGKVGGVEIFSLHTSAKNINPITFIPNALWSYGKYPGLTFARYFERPEQNLKKYDELTKTQRSTLFAGNDAHSNLGFHIFGDDANNKFLNFKFDKYETIFSLVRTHILLEKDKKLSEENLLTALTNGNAYVGIDILSDTTGFSYSAGTGSDRKIMGDEVFMEDGPIDLKAHAPQVSRFVIFKDGVKVFESKEATTVSFKVEKRGVYRVEVYLDSLGEPFNKMPWIISNPIYVR